MAKVIFSSLQQHTSATVDSVHDVATIDGMRVVTVYTDGSCKKPQDVGGWAFSAFNQNNELLIEQSGRIDVCTNNICEIQAMISAIKWVKDNQNTKKVQVHLYADSQYAIKGATQWIPGWKRRGWKTSMNETVKNQTLWEEMDALLKDVDVKFFWTKGHAKDEKNNRVDELAGATWAKPSSRNRKTACL